ncbi:MAG: sodium:alanine symporter family protein [Maricaulaceae bacterium]|jgi:AGCS family alanine or glycine:cation symporter
METIENILNTIDGWVWGWSPVSFLPPVLVLLLFGTGLYLTIGTRFYAFRRLPYAISLLFQRGKPEDKDEGEIAPVAALLTALAATIGTGNIAGVATAITLGGPGAVFWMWMTALFGMATKYGEAVLAVKYRETDKRGVHVGGPMYYIKNGLGKNWLWLAWAFAICTGIAAIGTGNLVQANGVAALFASNFNVPFWVTGAVMAVLTFFVIIGGVRSIARVASILVPVMAVLYIAGALIVLVFNAEYVPGALGMIFTDAFTGTAAAGGFIGALFSAAIREGANRGSFSNEAGLGSAAIAHASARTHDPQRQGTIAMLGTFIDTIVVCTMTALVILTAPKIFDFPGADGVAAAGDVAVWQSGIASAADVTAQAFGASMPGGEYIVTFGLMVFAFTTILGWALYGERAMEFMFGVGVILPYRILWCIVVFIGAIWTNNAAWAFASIGNGMMAAPNLIALLGLSGVIFAVTRQADQQRRAATRSEAAPLD